MSVEINESTRRVVPIRTLNRDTANPVDIYPTREAVPVTDTLGHPIGYELFGFDPDVQVISRPLLTDGPRFTSESNGATPDHSTLYQWIDSEGKVYYSYMLELFPKLDFQTAKVLWKAGKLWGASDENWYEKVKQYLLPNCLISPKNGLILNFRGNKMLHVFRNGDIGVHPSLVQRSIEGQKLRSDCVLEADSEPCTFEIQTEYSYADNTLNVTHPLFIAVTGVSFLTRDFPQIDTRVRRLARNGPFRRNSLDGIVEPYVRLVNVNEQVLHQIHL